MAGKHLVAVVMLVAACSWPATSTFAAGVFLEVPMTRVFVCKGTDKSADATMEIYLPQSLLQRRDIEKAGTGGTVNGLLALDLTAAQKGKVIEPVRLRSSKDNKAIVMQQFTRKGLKPATIPMSGGRLDLDPRLATRAQCEAYKPS